MESLKMIIAIKNKNELFISSDELLENATVEIINDSGEKIISQTFKNSEFNPISINKINRNFTLRILNNNKTIYQKIFTN